MEPKVHLSLNWHEGIPDGENNVTLIRDDFDIIDEKLTIEEIKKALLEYGAMDISYNFSSGHEYHFTAIIQKKNPHLPEYLARLSNPNEHDIRVDVSSILEHRGRYFELKEIEL
jgi:hypothetical protein